MLPSSNERERWNRKYRESPDSWREPDPFLLRAFSEYIRPLFPLGGHALDLAGGAGRHAIWLAKQGWKVTLIDIANAGIEIARENAGSFASNVDFVEDDLGRFQAPQMQFDLVLAFFYLERRIFPEIVKAVRPGGLLIYKTLTRGQLELAGGPKDPAYLLEEGELPRLAAGLQVLFYREQIADKATAELVARKNSADTK
ncbi:MAG: class I SAM-dependent methyltransferase [Candidatus Sulfotelmatobacter sp.]